MTLSDVNRNLTRLEFRPNSILSQYIHSYWLTRVKSGGILPSTILPDGCFDLLMPTQNRNLIGARVTGICNDPIEVCYRENIDLFGITFKPLALTTLFDFKLGDMLNRTAAFELKDLGLNIQVLLDRLDDFPGAVIEFLDDHFLSLLRKCTVDERLRRLFQIIETSSGCQSVKTISENIGLSPRQMQRNVTSLIGIGVKEYSKIIRFKRTLERIQHDPADYQNYCDQSHFIRDVKRYTGLTPDKIDLYNNVRFVQYYCSD